MQKAFKSDLSESSRKTLPIRQCSPRNGGYITAFQPILPFVSWRSTHEADQQSTSTRITEYFCRHWHNLGCAHLRAFRPVGKEKTCDHMGGRETSALPSSQLKEMHVHCDTHSDAVIGLLNCRNLRKSPVKVRWRDVDFLQSLLLVQNGGFLERTRTELPTQCV
jgi:hypothetical protein